eukprot:GHVR01058657.1.p1 GENE.GHVR01058657.1~~GHVR01058657.1.p1  ORF type:complete len:151 (-),score=23.61 GHVR01058657.1:164-616(-)
MQPRSSSNSAYDDLSCTEGCDNSHCSNSNSHINNVYSHSNNHLNNHSDSNLMFDGGGENGSVRTISREAVHDRDMGKDNLIRNRVFGLLLLLFIAFFACCIHDYIFVGFRSRYSNDSRVDKDPLLHTYTHTDTKTQRHEDTIEFNRSVLD